MIVIATASAVAFMVYSCKGKLGEAESLDINEVPVQTVDDEKFRLTGKGV